MTKRDTTLRTTAEVAAMLGVKPATITHWARKLRVGTRLVPGERTPLLFTPADITRLNARPKPADHLRVAHPSPAALYRREYRARAKIARQIAEKDA